MKKKNSAITHASFPQFVAKMESDSAKLNGRKIGRNIATWLNTFFSSAITIMALSIFYNSLQSKELLAEDAFKKLPELFLKAGEWALGLFPKDTSIWICMIILLVAIPVTGIITGLFFRFIPFRGKAFKADDAETEAERTDNAISLVGKLQHSYNASIDYFTSGTYVATLLSCLAAIVFPIISVCRVYSEFEWYKIVIAVIATFIQMLILMIVVLCVIGFGVFYLSLAQEAVTSLFYRGHDYKKEEAQLKEFRQFLDDEAKAQHEVLIAKTEDEAIDCLIEGKIAAALKTIVKVEDEAKDTYYIKLIADFLSKEKTVKDWVSCLDITEAVISSEKLRQFLAELKQKSREELSKIAVSEYPKALNLYESGDYGEARELLRSSLAVDYRDGAALFALSDYGAGRTQTYSWIIEKLSNAVEKGVESEKLELECLKAIERAKSGQKREREYAEQKKAEELERQAAEEAYWLEVGRQMNRTCKYMIDGYCCRYCTIDNFPHKCYYLDRPDDMWMCDDRKS